MIGIKYENLKYQHKNDELWLSASTSKPILFIIRDNYCKNCLNDSTVWSQVLMYYLKNYQLARVK